MSMNVKKLPIFVMNATWLFMIIMMVPAIMSLKSNFSVLTEWAMLSNLSTPLSFTLIFDMISLVYSMVVLFISANVLTFSLIYMKEDKFITRFTLLVVAFVISMNMLIFIPHFMMLLLGWDGLGVTSFILIIYYQNPKSLAAGMITALTNRIGDVAILLSIAWTMTQGHWNIMHMMISPNLLMQMTMITMAAMTKSAQMPFSSWLPAAMAAPTPVSALVHSSTLVTAGVFLIIRFYPFLSMSNMFNKIMLFIAVSTLLMSGFSACTECDMKKIIALSTLSQLGMMMTSIGLGLPNLAFIHMVIHALFKALLFICAGNMINLHSHAQDLRWMGNTSNSLPVTSSCMLIANMALCGMPFMSGFYSKDMIIELSMHSTYNLIMVSLIVFSVMLTSMYSLRFSVVTLWGPRTHKPMNTLNDNSIVNKPMIKMSMMSIASGSMILWLMPTTEIVCTLPTLMKNLTIFMVFIGVLFGFILSKILSTSKSKMMTTYMTHYSSCMMWFLVPVASQFMLKLPLLWGHYMLKYVDQAWIEVTSSQGIYLTISSNSSSMSKLLPNSFNMYMLLAIMSMIFMIMLMALNY